MKSQKVITTCIVFQMICILFFTSAIQGDDIQLTAYAGPDQHFPYAGELVVLDGSGSNFQNPQNGTFTWSQVSGPNVVLSDARSVNPEFVPLEEGEYHFELIVEEESNHSEPDEVTVWIGFMPTQPYLQEWAIEEGGNGHWYQAICYKGSSDNPGISWKNAKLWSKQSGGYLATITSEDENWYVFKLFYSIEDCWYKIENIPSVYWFGPWLGGYQEPGSVEPNGGWNWVTGEPFEYTAWHSGEPTGWWNGKNEDVLQYFFNDYYGVLPEPLWSDAYDGIGARHPNGFIAEYDAFAREAESEVVLFQAEVNDVHSGFTGTGYVQFSDLEGSTAEWDISVGPAGLRRLNFRYANGFDESAFIQIDTNDTNSPIFVEFPSTGSWDSWEDLVIRIPYIAGENVLRATLIGGPGPAIDSICIADANTNLVLGKDINFSAGELIDNVVAVVDANLMSSWDISASSEWVNKWVEVDLGGLYEINRSHVAVIGENACQFKVEAKPAIDEQYVICVDRTENDDRAALLAPLVDAFNPIAARYVRITVTGVSGDVFNPARIREFRIFSTVGEN
jgi:hypothetical protein